MGDKVAARREMIKAGVPVVPGTDECVADFQQARGIAKEIGYPVIIKPSGGGGGIGMTIVANEGELAGPLSPRRRLPRPPSASAMSTWRNTSRTPAT